ncbi:MAG: LysE family transporter [Bacteroidota bacterium]|nr:LysE family transporter [Bacteroidota bacterium]
MTIGLLLKGILMGLVVSVPLGPVGVMCIQRTINRGMKSGLISGIGAASADTVYAIIAGFGLGYIVNFINQEKYWIQLIGAIIIIGMAIKIFYTNPAVELRNRRNKKSKPLEDFISVFLVTLSNPAVFFVFIAMFAGFNVVSSQPNNYLSVLIAIGSIFLGAASWWYVLSAVVNKFRSRIRLKNIWWLNKIMGVIVFICGLVALIDLYL